MTRDERERERELAHLLDRLPDLGPSLPLVLEEIGGPEVGAFARGFLFGRESGRAERPAPAPVNAAKAAVDARGFDPAWRPAGPWKDWGGYWIRSYDPSGSDVAAIVFPDLSWWEVFAPCPATHAIRRGRAESLDAAKAAVDAILGPAW